MPARIGESRRMTERNSAPAHDRLDALEDREFAQRVAWLHGIFSPRAAEIVAERDRALLRSRSDVLPAAAPPSGAPAAPVELPGWCRDASALLSVPADSACRVLGAFDSGAPAIMLDLEDSVVDLWPQTSLALANVQAALERRLTCVDPQGGRARRAARFPTFTAVRVRGLQDAQHGIVPDEALPAPLYDLASIVYGVDHARLRHPLCVVIPRAQSVDEAIWWRDVFQALAGSLGLPSGYIRCIVLADSLNVAFSLDAFVGTLRSHCIGIAFGRRGYLASLIRYFNHDPAWILPDLAAIDVRGALFAGARERIVNVAHASGMLALGAATTSLADGALAALAAEKADDARARCDGAFVIHPGHVAATTSAFTTPAPTDCVALQTWSPTLAPPQGPRTRAGSAAAARALLVAQFAMLSGHGAVRVDDELVDRTTQRIHRLMLSQRIRHRQAVTACGGGRARVHDRKFLGELFNEALHERLHALPHNTPLPVYRRYREARIRAESSVAQEDR